MLPRLDLLTKETCRLLRRGEKWWPARVTHPVLRIKSPLHHFNACEPKVAFSNGKYGISYRVRLA